MTSQFRTLNRLAFVGAMLAALPAAAQTPEDTLAGFRQAAPSGTSFSASRGEQFFKATHGNDWSCATCHTQNPANPGKHAKTDRVIKPLAPSANSARFADPAKVEKWFKRNCNDVLGRACTAQEKGDVLTYLLTLK